MAKLKLSKAYIPLEIEFDDGEVLKLRIDTKDRDLFRKIQELQEFADDYKLLQLQLEEATAVGGNAFLETMAAGELAQEMADALAGGIKLFIGDEGYNEILTRLGDGKPIEAADANFVMIQVFQEIESLVVEYFNSTGQKLNKLADKAAHYLAEANNAQAEPNKN